MGSRGQVRQEMPAKTPLPARSGISVQPSVVLVALMFGGYVLTSRGLHDLFPFSTYSMYSGEHSVTASRIVARDQSGQLHELEDFAAWTCPAPIDFNPPRCSSGGAVYSIGYIDRDRQEYLDRARGHSASARPVTLTRHIWHFRSSNGPPTIEDCDLASCTAAPR